MNGGLASYLTGTAGLAILLTAAILLTLGRPRVSADGKSRSHFSLVAAAAIAVQIAHFVEEWLGQFHARFPALFGLEPWSVRFFVTFNVLWLLIWSASVLAVRRRVVAGLAPLWFLGLALAANAVAHPALALAVGSYFPGLFTAPVVGIAGGVLLRQLARLTSGQRQTGPGSAGRGSSG